MAKEDVPEQAETQRPTGPMGPSRVLARDISVYYSNCAMVATTPAISQCFSVDWFQLLMTRAGKRWPNSMNGRST